MNKPSDPGTHPATQTIEDHESAPEQKAIGVRPALAIIAAVVLVTIVLAGVGILRRQSAAAVLAERTQELAAPTVIVAPAKAGAPVTSFVLPGNVTAFTDAPIYARTNGYLTRWTFDIGARVKKGALLAEIATPELDRQLQQAEADLATAQANAENARQQAERYSGLVQSHAVSRQDTEAYVNQAAATAAAVRSAQANIDRLRQLQGYEKIYAPFDGVITARTVDTGQLIDAGAGKELFRLQALGTLRVYVNLPENESAHVKRGAKVDLTFVEYPGKSFQGTLVRTADAIDPASRTLLVEIDVDNRSGELLPGALAQAHFKTDAAASSFIVPVTALIFRKDGLRVGTVVKGSDGAVARLLPVVMGEDDGAAAQIVSGLSASDQIIQDPPDSLIDGQRVTVVTAAPSAPAGGK
jgi:RND family efflux transporter MFP subunit